VLALAITLETNIQYLKGVGEKRAALYQKLGVTTVGELLYHFPREYMDLSEPHTIQDAPLQENCAVRARLMHKSPEQRIRAGLSLYRLRAEDETGVLEITMFNTKFTVDSLQLDTEYIFYGRIGGTLLHREMNAPVIYPLPEDKAILPIYPQTAGISSKMIRRHILQALADLPDLSDLLPETIREAYDLPAWQESLRSIHFPETFEAAHRARERFIFEEFLVLCCGLSVLRTDHHERTAIPMESRALEPFYDALPFVPTGAQIRAIDEAVGDLCGGIPMNRLIQGDVGSGKTLVAAACIYFCTRNGYQSAMMAPTEILAEQHHATLSALLAPSGIRVGLLTGSTKAAEKKAIRAKLADGELDLIVGTHALLSEGVEFGRLALVITDEQHRFGVAQRAKLADKSKNVHVLVMSATPIPRTLSLIVYGDLSLSVIDELPPGRQAIDTFVVSSGKRQRALTFLRKALDGGRQAYIICPLIEMGEEDVGLRPAKEYAEQLAKNELKGYKISLLHGKMKAAEKDDIMRRFSRGEIQALVSTTVVEVGVDVPNATMMLIENAERFGLSQLHQLRGRVGRGKEKSYCILISDAKGETARGRLQMMKSTGDGFLLAEYDLKARGPGDFFGYRQHGLPELKVASLSENPETMRKAKECADKILAEDPTLSTPAYARIGVLMRHRLASVGSRPN
jgi:ATP-dependent DNA helicase RecG